LNKNIGCHIKKMALYCYFELMKIRYAVYILIIIMAIVSLLEENLPINRNILLIVFITFIVIDTLMKVFKGNNRN